MQVDGRQYWFYLDRFWWDNDNLSPYDVQALVHQRDDKKRRTLARAHDLYTGGEDRGPQRHGISLEIKRAVWERDAGRCHECGSQFELQYDHIIPVAFGGATTIDNLQVLCGECNRRKGASLG